MAFSGMLRHVVLVRTDVSVASYSEMSVLARATRRNIPEDGILQIKYTFSYGVWPYKCTNV
jgi:hypothetical protein